MDPSFMAQQQAQQASQQAQQAHQQAVQAHQRAHQQHVHGGYHRPAHVPMPHRGGRGGGLFSLVVVIVVVVVFARDPELRDTVLNEIQQLVDRIQSS
ncbi:hypothetical protein [Streptomyces sp. S.PB5]|uniref:hypothetical protein n=1 Tax=Streptomyces sp. S.PB5 TaxID=3020844 RepID=UPI0025B15210|nr:hypothetical protein [Streptomyces sp. S.PB5]MDN3021774.1 hypothetical protein [Streptomyces sp. S.PB5]